MDGRQMLNDCWFLPVTNPEFFSRNVYDTAPVFTWRRCDVKASEPLPSPRYGHSATIHSGTVFMFGGYHLASYSTFSLSSELNNDVWALESYSTDNRRWKEITPLSEKPPKRAFNALWMTGGEDGFKIIIHGGQSEEGQGSNPVVSDTWRFDLSTMVWTSYSSDPLAPALSHGYVMPITNSTVVLYGGRTAANNLFGRTMVMHVAQGWRTVLAAGSRPQRRTGHVVTYDNIKYAMTISHGINLNGRLLSDTWRLDLSGEQGTWACIAGTGPECPREEESGVERLRPPPLAFAAYATSRQTFFTFSGLVEGSNGPIQSDAFWTLSLTTQQWTKVVPDQVKSSHSFPTDVVNYQRWDPNDATSISRSYDPNVKPPMRYQSAAVMIGPIARMSKPLLVLGGIGQQGPLDDIWIIDTAESSIVDAARDGMLYFDGIDDLIAIPLPSFVSTTRSMSGMWIDAWMQLETGDGSNVVLWDAMTGESVVLRVLLTTTNGLPYARLIYYPGVNKQVIIKTWGPITTEGFTSSWHHIAFVLRFAHFSAGALSEPDAIPVQAFFFVDCVPVKDDGKFMLLDLKQTRLSQGLHSISVGGVSSRASQMARSGYTNFNGYLDNIRIWWPQCPPGPSKCNPFAFLYPQQDYAPFQRVPSSGIKDSEVVIDDVAPMLRHSMFADRMATNATDLLISIEVDHEDKSGGILIDTSTWLPATCASGRSGSTACDGCPDKCFFDTCHEYDVDCIERRVSEDNIKWYAENGECECFDAMTCPKYTENCKCPSAFVRPCSKYRDDACIEWGCVCADRMSTECSLCILNGNRQDPPDPCLAPGSCMRSACVFPFLKKYDVESTTGSGTSAIKTPTNQQIETIEMTRFVTDMVGRYLDTNLYERTKLYVLNIMEYSCYAYHWSSMSMDGPSRDDDKRCQNPADYDNTTLFPTRCKCTFEDSTVREQTSLRNKIGIYWKSGYDSWSRSDEQLSKAPQMYNLSLALSLICKAGGCFERKKNWGNGMEENPLFCPTTRIDADIFMDNLVGDKDSDNLLSETEFLNQYALLTKIKAVQWNLDPMAAATQDTSTYDATSTTTCADGTCR